VTPALGAVALGRRYRRTWGLRDCSLAIPAGRVVALVGPNGAGKTTMLQLAAGLLAPTTGRVEVFGASPHERPNEVLPRIGFLAQDAPLYRSFAVADALAFGRHLNPRWDTGLARERLRALGIPLDRRVGALSGGQRAQVALTMALAKRAELLLLDEPVASLDPLARREFLQGLLEAVATDGITVVLSSHVLADLERSCDYLVILASGLVHLAGDIDEVCQRHKLLTGSPEQAERLAGRLPVISQSRAERQATLLVRTYGALPGPGFDARDVGLEELVLAYLERARGGGSAGGPDASRQLERTEVGS